MERKRLPDTPWHVGYTKKDEADPRRHKARCIFITNGFCKNGHCGCFLRKCGGSAHCQYYSESIESWHEVWRKTRSLAQEMAENEYGNWDRARQAQENRIRDAIRKLEKDRLQFRQYSFTDRHRCPICDTKLVSKAPVKICPYCQSVFVKEGSRFQNDESAFILKDDAKEVKYQGKTVIVSSLTGTHTILRQNPVPVKKEHEKPSPDGNAAGRGKRLSAAAIQALNNIAVEDAGFSKKTLMFCERNRIRKLGLLAKLAEAGQLRDSKGAQKEVLTEILDRIQTKTGISFHELYF